MGVVGFWVSLPNEQPSPQYTEAGKALGAQPSACTPTNVTWVIRWKSKGERDAGWDALRALKEYKEVSALRTSMFAAKGFNDKEAYRQVEVKFCIDVPGFPASKI